MLQDHIWNKHCSRSMFAICSWSSVDFKSFQIWSWLFDLEYSTRLLMVQDHKVLMVQDHMVLDHMVQDHIIGPKSLKSCRKCVWKESESAPMYSFLEYVRNFKTRYTSPIIATFVDDSRRVFRHGRWLWALKCTWKWDVLCNMLEAVWLSAKHYRGGR